MITANRFTPTYDAANEARERARPYPSIMPPHTKRFCESCQSYKPKHGYAAKGWKCRDCQP